MKKNITLLFISMCLSFCLLAQETTNSVSGGLVGAANYSRFKITDRGSLPLESKWKWGYAAGVFLNFPLGNVVSIEPQALYSVVGSKAELSGIESLDQQLGYLSVPLFVKFHLGEYVALALGPQFDFKLSAKDKLTDVSNKDDFKSTSIAGTGGIEFFPRGRVTIYGRYIHGLTKIEEPSTTAPYLYNQAFQAGLKFKLFGGKKKVTPPPP
ncbi:MAG: PorT family protein, partial [Chitinophagaceae bacterium]